MMCSSADSARAGGDGEDLLHVLPKVSGYSVHELRAADLLVGNDQSQLGGGRAGVLGKLGYLVHLVPCFDQKAVGRPAPKGNAGAPTRSVLLGSECVGKRIPIHKKSPSRLEFTWLVNPLLSFVAESVPSSGARPRPPKADRD